MKPFSLQAQQVEEMWPLLAPLLEVFERTCKTLKTAQIREAARQSRQQIFGLGDECRIYGLLVTEIQETSAGRQCVLVVAVGQAPEPDKRALVEGVRAWAREIGCTSLKIMGRRGWARWDRRFRQTGVVLEAPL